MRTTSSHSTRALAAFAGIGLLLGAAACSSDSGSSNAATGEITADEQPYVDAMVQSITADQSAPFSATQATCLAKGMVNIIGVDAFQQAGITPDSIAGGGTGDPVLGDLAPGKTDELVTLVFDGGCFDFGDLMASQLTQDTSVSIDKDKASCLGDAMAKSDGFRQAFVASLTGDDSEDPFAQVDLFKMFSDCGVNLGDVTATT